MTDIADNIANGFAETSVDRTPLVDSINFISDAGIAETETTRRLLNEEELFRMLLETYYNKKNCIAMEAAMAVFSRRRDVKDLQPRQIKALTKRMSYVCKKLDEKSLEKLVVFNIQGAAKLRMQKWFVQYTSVRTAYAHFLSHAGNAAEVLYKKYQKNRDARRAVKWAKCTFRLASRAKLYLEKGKKPYESFIICKTAEFLYEATGELAWLKARYDNEKEITATKVPIHFGIRVGAYLHAGYTALELADKTNKAEYWLKEACSCFSNAAGLSRFYNKETAAAASLERALAMCDLFFATANKEYARQANYDIDDYVRLVDGLSRENEDRLIMEKEFLRVFLGNEVKFHKLWEKCRRRNTAE